MSLNKTLDRLFDEIRREAKRNPDFANRLDAVLRLHDSRRDVPDEVIEGLREDEAPLEAKRAPSARTAGVSPAVSAPKSKKSAGESLAVQEQPTPSINPAGLFKREGEEALVTALASQKLSALRAMVAEHNLDPSGVTPSLTRDELAAHILAQAKRRAERDEKMFDY
jgi:hypothetical protein